MEKDPSALELARSDALKAIDVLMDQHTEWQRYGRTFLLGSGFVTLERSVSIGTWDYSSFFERKDQRLLLGRVVSEAHTLNLSVIDGLESDGRDAEMDTSFFIDLKRGTLEAYQSYIRGILIDGREIAEQSYPLYGINEASSTEQWAAIENIANEAANRLNPET